MGLKITKVNVWAASIKDRPGGLAEKLAALAKAGASLEFVISRRASEKPGTGVVFLTPLKNAKQIKAGKKAGFSKTKSLHSLRIEGPDKRGMGATITQTLASAGVNLRGFSAAAIGKKFVCYLALDTSAAAAKATRTLKTL